MGIFEKLFRKKTAEGTGVTFERYPSEGNCDVCNLPFGPGEAYLVPKDIFYASRQYREWLSQSPVGQMGIAATGSIEAFIIQMRSMDKTNHSAVCPRCIYMFAKIEEESAEEWFVKGEELINLGKNKEALECYEKALKINPQYVQAWFKKGSCLGSLNRLQEATEAFEKFVKLAPSGSEWEGLVNLAKNMIRLYDSMRRQGMTMPREKED
jgi:tetratricopeptide (TPR) repeat protein